MKAQLLLYARSRKRDYRWLLQPSFFTVNDLTAIYSIYQNYDKYKTSLSLTKSGLPTLFCMNMSSAIVIFTCIESQYNDIQARPIYALSGIAAPHEDKKEFSAYLQYLVDHNAHSLLAWRYFDFSRADTLDSNSFEINLDATRLNESASMTLQQYKRKAHIQMQSMALPLLLPFSSDGLAYILRLLVSPHIPVFSFAFGADEAIAKLTQWDVISTLP